MAPKCFSSIAQPGRSSASNIPTKTLMQSVSRIQTGSLLTQVISTQPLVHKHAGWVADCRSFLCLLLSTALQKPAAAQTAVSQPAIHMANPDGGTVDSEGGYWSAEYGSARVVRFVHDKVDMVVQLPVANPTSCTFGGQVRDCRCRASV